MKLPPILKDVRLHAENAITLIDEARAVAPLREQEALDALALGARRIDFIGMKFQFADEIAHAYADAWSQAATPHSHALAIWSRSATPTAAARTCAMATP